MAEFEPVGVDPESARDQCQTESYRFHLHLRECDIESELVSGFLFGDFMGTRVIVGGHTAVRVGEVVYDWTARQFEPDAALPQVMSLEEWDAKWTSLTKAVGDKEQSPTKG